MLIDRTVFVEGTAIKGRVIDETKNALKIATSNGIKTVIKDNNTFLMNVNGKETRLHGTQIRLRPWEYAI